MGRPPWSSSGRARSSRRWKRPTLKADKQVAKQLDVKSKDIDKAVREAAGNVG